MRRQEAGAAAVMTTMNAEHMRAREFQERLTAAAPGETIVYAVDFLVIDIHQAFLAKDPNGCLSATSCCGTSSSMPPMSRARTRKETRLKEADFPLVRGGKIPRAALLWLAEVERVFPGTTKDIIIVRQKPISPTPRGGEIGDSTQRERIAAK